MISAELRRRPRMLQLAGRVDSGFGVAAGNLADITSLICLRMGLRSLVPGTLNVRLDRGVSVMPDALVASDEYHGWERLKLRRCCINGMRGVVVRPESHESGNGHGPACLEIVAEVHLRSALGLADGDLVQVTFAAPHLSPPCWSERVRRRSKTAE